MALWSKLGIIAGGGELPVVLAEHCAATHRPYFVARVTPYADAALDAHPGTSNSLGHMGARMDAMREAGCDAIVLLGQVPRQDPRNLNLDAGGMAMVPALLAAAPQGDDALLRALLSEHERAGFHVIGADEAMSDLLAQPGAWGAVAPTPARPSARLRQQIAHRLVGADHVKAGALMLGKQRAQQRIIT
ncbi:MAG TPA: DUF1009 domain-containing protein, partial [Verrucomicrobiae bacterium]|nr:DUF1009 domain-containing protein [Verrucomicrobiae bacterium]